MRLTLSRAGVVLRQPSVPIKPGPCRKPAIVCTQRLDRITPGRIKLRLEIVRARVHIILDAIRALAIRVVVARDLHQARCGTSRVGIAGGLLHSDDGENDRVDTVLGCAALEVAVVLGAGGTNAVVEVLKAEGVDVVEGEEGRLPAGGGDAGVEPVFGARCFTVSSNDSKKYVAKERYPFGPVLGVTLSVAPCALGFLPTPGLAD